MTGTNTVEHYEAMLKGMDPKAKAELDRMIAAELAAAWKPDPRNIPQMVAYHSKAKWLLYGGAAGGGKTDLLCGLALTQHEKSVIFRAQYKDLRGIEDRLLTLANKGGREGYNGQDMVLKKDGRTIELGAIGGVGQENDWQGRPHDLIGIDEAAQIESSKITFVAGWLRSTKEGQHTRIVLASNPPLGGEGEWLMEWFGPWLNPMFPNPAKPGELRWAYFGPDGKTVWCDGPDIVHVNGEEYTPESRTFIPARLDDNPYLKDTGYRGRIQSMPEPMRSKLLKGDFLAGRADHDWQIIPTAWVEAAMERWHPQPPPNARQVTLGVDVGGSGTGAGGDPHIIAPLYSDNWFAQCKRIEGVDAKNGPALAAQILMARENNALPGIDMTGGWGGSARDHLTTNSIPTEGVIFNMKSGERTKDDKFFFVNVRAEMYWRLREGLDPKSGEKIKLPPSPRLKAELTAARWKLVRGNGIQVEDKDEIKKRLGSSPDEADATVIAWHLRNRAAMIALQSAGGMPEDAAEIEDPLAGF